MPTDEPDSQELAGEVRSLIRTAVQGDHPAWKTASHSARRVAAGLLRLLELLDSDDLRPDGATLEASAALNALITGEEHPIWRFIDGQASTRVGRPYPNYVDRLRRGIAIALVQALQLEEGLPRQPLTRATEMLRTGGVSVTADQLKGWLYRSDPVQMEISAELLQQVLMRAGELGLRGSDVALQWAKLWWAAPDSATRVKSPTVLT